MKKTGVFLLVVLGISLIGFDPAGAASVQTICVRPTPVAGRPATFHPVFSGVPTTLKGIVKSDVGGLTYEWDPGDGSVQVMVIRTVIDPYVIEAEHTYFGPVGTTFTARLTVTDPVSGVRSTDTYNLQIVPQYAPGLDDPVNSRAIAIEKSLWWAHKQLLRYQGPAGAEGYLDWMPAQLPVANPASGAPSIIVAQGLVDVGYKLASAIHFDPVYTEDVQRLVNYVVGRLMINPIGNKGDGSPQYPFLNPEERGGEVIDGLGVYFDGLDLEYEQGAALRLLATCGLAEPGISAPPANPWISQWTFRQVLQQMVDFLAWSQVYQHPIDYGDPWNPAGRVVRLNTGALAPAATRGSWPYWWEGFHGSWDPTYDMGSEGDVAIGYWAVDGIRAAEKRGASVPAFVKNELRLFLSNNQDSDSTASNPYYGELYFGPARAHHLVERAGEGLLLFEWAGMDTSTDQVRAAIGFIDRFWNEHNYSHLTMWPWDQSEWDRDDSPRFSHFKRGALYDTGYWKCVNWDPINAYCSQYDWFITGSTDEMNIFAFLTVTQGLQAQSQTNPAVMAPFPNARNYQREYLELMLKNQQPDGSWDDSAWVYRMTLGQGWALMLLSRLMADNDRDGWHSDSDCDDDDPAVNPGAPELCNGIDDSCNGLIDEGCGGGLTAPLLSPPGGICSASQLVTLVSPTAGASLRYTLDGSWPTPMHGTVIPSGGTVLVDHPLTLRAAACLDGACSPVASADYQFQTAVPGFSPGAGLSPPFQLVKITSATAGAKIAYTTDGSTPSRTNGVQAGSGTSLSLTGSLTLKALAYLPNWLDSAVATAAYTVTTLRAEAPVFTPWPALYSTPQTVTITTSGGGAAIRYTTDGTTPTRSSGTPIPSGGTLLVDRTTVLKAFAYSETTLDSTLTTATYTMRTATPVFAPPGGSYFTPQTVTITTATPGAQIRYTTDGTTPSPTNGSELASGGTLPVERTLVLRAFAFRAGWTPAAVVSGTYTFRASLPVLSQFGGTYADTQNVTITSSTPGAQIRYTTDGTTLPTESVGTLLANGGTVTVNRSLTLKALAHREGWTPTSVVSSTNTLKAAPPVFSPSGTTYYTPQSVTISTNTPGGSISYTTDGTTPSQAHGTVIAGGGSVFLDRTANLKAVAFKPGWTDTSVVSGAYTFRAALPVFSQLGGLFAAEQSVTITSSTPGAQIRYTTDGTTLPTETVGTLLENGGTVAVNRSLALKAIAWREGWTPTSVVSSTNTLKAAPPVFSPFGTTYYTPQSVTISTNTPGGSISYTTDGTLPSQTNGTVLNGGGTVFLDRTAILKAVAFKPGWTDTNVASGSYTFRTALPVFSQLGGLFSSEQGVTITSSTPGAQIRYTTDGTTLPTATVGVLLENGGTVTVNRSLTLKAIACREGWTPTGVVSSTNTLKAAPPAFSPLGTTYYTPQSVTISSPTPDTLISYTTDGTLPSQTHGTVLSGGGTVYLDRTVSLKAVAFKPGWTDTRIASGNYTFRAALPVLSQIGGTYSDSQSVRITSTTPGAQIRYTTDGTLPCASSGAELANGASVLVDRTLVLRAMACREGWTPTGVVSATNTLKAAPPVFSPLPTTYSAPQSVTISTATPGGSISYTTDGTLPSQTHGTVIAGGDSVLLERTAILRAVAFKPGWTDTGVVSGSYTFRASLPTFSPPGGLYFGAQSVTISSPTPGARIRYTTDGTIPTATSGTEIASGGAVPVDRTLVLRAIAARDGWSSTGVASGSYTIKEATLTAGP